MAAFVIPGKGNDSFVLPPIAHPHLAVCDRGEWIGHFASAFGPLESKRPIEIKKVSGFVSSFLGFELLALFSPACRAI